MRITPSSFQAWWSVYRRLWRPEKCRIILKTRRIRRTLICWNLFAKTWRGQEYKPSESCCRPCWSSACFQDLSNNFWIFPQGFLVWLVFKKPDKAKDMKKGMMATRSIMFILSRIKLANIVFVFPSHEDTPTSFYLGIQSVSCRTQTWRMLLLYCNRKHMKQEISVL